jgi:hypothetical protein
MTPVLPEMNRYAIDPCEFCNYGCCYRMRKLGFSAFSQGCNLINF